MKILHISTSDISGGAARAAYRLHRALLSKGINSQMLVQHKASDDYTVRNLDSNFQKIRTKFSSSLNLLPLRHYPSRSATPFSTANMPFSGLSKIINEINPDIVHLHWINGGMMQIEDIEKIISPIVWTLHDMWAFTGGCHYDEECGAFQGECGNCKVLKSNKAFDLSRRIYNKKLSSYSKIKEKLMIVGVSNWISELATKSSLLRDVSTINLPNILDTDIFSPINKNIARELLKLPKNKKLILFGAVNAVVDHRKGFNKLCEALNNVSQDMELIIFGSTKPKEKQGFNQKAHYLGYLHDNIALRLLYSAADVMVVPSIQEAFGQTASEAMSCGTAVVSFATTGLLDIVDHMKNGYLAVQFDSKDLARGIEWVVFNENYFQLSSQARTKAVESFSSKLNIKKYIDMYVDVK